MSNSINSDQANGSVKKVKPMKSSKFNFGLILSYGIALASVAFAGAVFMWVIIPQISIYTENKEKVEKLEAKLKKVSAQVKYLEELSNIQDELEQNISLSEEALPVTKDYIPFMLEQLVSIGGQSGVTIESLGFGGISGVGEKGLSSVKIQMKVSGPYSNVLSFIEKLQTARRLVDANSIQVSKSTKKDEVNQTYSVTLSLSAYFMPDADTENVSIEALTANTNYQGVLDKLETLDYYDVEATRLSIGNDNPFEEGIDIITGEELDFDNEDEFEGFE